MSLQILIDPRGNDRGTRFRYDNFAAFIRVLACFDFVEVKRHLVDCIAFRGGVHLKTLALADRGTGKAVSVTAKTVAVILAVCSPPHNREADHFGVHSVSVIDDSNPRW